MQAGAMRHLVTLLEPSNGERSEYGSVIVKYQPRIKVWAEIRQQSAREIMASQQVQSTSTYTVIMRRPPVKINEKWRIQYQGETYNIRGILNNPTRDELTITAEIASYEQE